MVPPPARTDLFRNILNLLNTFFCQNERVVCIPRNRSDSDNGRTCVATDTNNAHVTCIVPHKIAEQSSTGPIVAITFVSAKSWEMLIPHNRLDN